MYNDLIMLKFEELVVFMYLVFFLRCFVYTYGIVCFRMFFE